jgi:hypothetical protein
VERILDQDLQQFAKFAESDHLTLGVATRSYDSMVHIMKMVKGDGKFFWSKKNEKKKSWVHKSHNNIVVNINYNTSKNVDMRDKWWT